ncbi:MAG: arylmalonate decarboxylase [Steroidobacteraceae bacterium]|nr:arylmalonate decarboxylase [Steroidobacteraceae bacterium]
MLSPHTTSASKALPRRLGLIFPPAGRGVPEEGLAMYGDRIEYLIETLGLETMTPDGYDAVIDRIGPAAKQLAERGAEAIVLMGTSLSFYRGEEFNRVLTNRLQEASRVACTTMSTAITDGLKAVGARKVVVATAYNETVNERVRAFLAEHGFTVLAVKGLGIEAVEDISSVTQPQLIEFGASVVSSAPQADALLISCGGLRTLEILAPLEARTKIPAVSSTPHALRAGARLVGLDGKVAGYGALLSR